MYSPYVSGPTTFINVLAEEYVKAGHEVVIFTYRGATNPLKDRGVRVITFFKMPAFIYPKLNVVIPNPFTFTEIIRKEAPDIIHSNTPGPLSSMAARAGKELGIPTLITFHGLMDNYYQYLSVSTILHLAWIPFPQITVYDNAKKMLIRAFIRSHFKKFNVVTVSTPLTKKIVEKEGIQCELVRIGLDIKTFHQKTKYEKSNNMLSVSRLGFEKKLDIVLHAMKKIQNPKLRLTVLGDGPARPMLEKLTKELRLSKQVKFLGNVQRSTLQKYFDSHDFFVNASDTETFGYVTAEAMAGGLPILGVKSQGTGELIQEGVNGFLAAPNNVDSFAR